MTASNQNKWPIIERLQFIPIRPFGRIDENLIGKFAMKQNRYVSQLESFTLQGYQNLDTTIHQKDGETATLRKLLLFSKDHTGRLLFEMVERANSDQIFLIYDKKQDHQET